MNFINVIYNGIIFFYCRKIWCLDLNIVKTIINYTENTIHEIIIIFVYYEIYIYSMLFKSNTYYIIQKLVYLNPLYIIFINKKNML